MQPNIYICRTEGRNGSVLACFYLEAGQEIYGWRVSGRGHRFAAAFFMLENFYADQQAALYRSVEDDVYGPWMIDYPRHAEEIRSPLPEPIQHELERLQSLFVQEWLFFENDPDAEADIAAYDRQHLQVNAVNLRLRKLNRLTKEANRWEFRSPAFDNHVSDYLQKYLRVSDFFIQQWNRPAESLPVQHSQWR